jgi:hypothetical protein
MQLCEVSGKGMDYVMGMNVEKRSGRIGNRRCSQEEVGGCAPGRGGRVKGWQGRGRGWGCGDCIS